MMDVKSFLRPTFQKIVITLLIPIPVDILVTLRVDLVLDFYYYLFTPFIKVYADVMYTESNYFLLLWIPFYIIACIIVGLVKRRG